ncbi:MAG: hypothetical protein JJU37_04375 [Balneolaceae bacterium]|nr:hypothetical protein [Balneolaceae bacterium]
MTDLLKTEYTTVDEVAEGLSEFEKLCLETGDLRGVFATAYLEITRAIAGQMESSFRDPEWVASYLIRFGNLYREALLSYENGKLKQVPKSWFIAFETAKRDEGLIIQHLILGINAHINHDLAISLYDVGIDPGRSDKYHDHTEINNILQRSTERLKREVSTKYAPILARLDRKTGQISDDVTNFSIPKAREHAWIFAVALSNAKSGTERTILRKALDEQAAVLARLIMASPTKDPRFTRSVTIAKRINGVLTRIRRFFRRS